VKFRFLAVDPPWRHNNRRATRKDNPNKATRFGIGAQGHYRVMATSEIAALGPYVQAVCTPDAYMAMWVLESMPADVKPVLDAWGVEQVCPLLAWIKLNSKAGTPCTGPGKYSFGNLERCILARRNRKKFTCWHSTAEGCWKPQQILYARRHRPGWVYLEQAGLLVPA